MKKIFFPIVIIFIFLGCSLQNDIPNLQINPDVTNMKTGTVHISFPSSSKMVDFETAQAETNIYEFIVYNDSYFISGTSEMKNSTLSVPVGVYKVLVLAGSKYLDTSLLGSGVVDHVEVIQDQRKDVYVNLTNIDSNLSAPAEVICGREFTISLSGDTSNSVIHFPSRYLLDGNSGLVKLDTITDGQKFEASVTLEAPTTPGTEIFFLTGVTDNLLLVDPDYDVYERLNITREDWTWLSKFSNMDDSHPEISKTITYIEDPTGIGVSVNW